MVELLLDQGTDVDLEGSEYGSAAAHCGDMETVKILLGRGANINIRGKHGSPINVAADSEQREVVELLMDKITVPLGSSYGGSFCLP